MILFGIEIACIISYFFISGSWIFNENYNYNNQLFEPHPYLVGVPKKNTQLTQKGITYTHNMDGFRGNVFNLKKNKKRIISIGGSTTYGVGVGDRQTWPFYLDSLLSDSFEVLNFGIPGHSTVEHIIQSAFILPEYQPDIVIIHCGLNDMRNMYVKDLYADYSNFHAPHLFGTLGFCYQNALPKIGIIKMGVLVLQKIGWYPKCIFHKMQLSKKKFNTIDTYALYLYQRNFKTLIAICKNFNIKPILLPQVLLEEAFKVNKLRWWIPYISDEQLITHLNYYNGIMQKVALEDSIPFVQGVLHENWKKDDFADFSHLNKQGNLKFAKIIEKQIKSK